MRNPDKITIVWGGSNQPLLGVSKGEGELTSCPRGPRERLLTHLVNGAEQNGASEEQAILAAVNALNGRSWRRR